MSAASALQVTSHQYRAFAYFISQHVQVNHDMKIGPAFKLLGLSPPTSKPAMNQTKAVSCFQFSDFTEAISSPSPSFER